MPVFSLGGKYGIGTFGSALKFVDFLAEVGADAWQVLPLCPVGVGASPYSSSCSDALEPLFIDPDALMRKGLVTKAECAEYITPVSRISYPKLGARMELFLKAFERSETRQSGNFDYALFMTLKAYFGGKPWYEWGEYADYACHNIQKFYLSHKREVEFYQFLQQEAFEQWNAVKTYAHEKNIQIIGDLPFYVAHDSVEVWRNKDIFMLDGNMPKSVAGVPPDYFSETGQLWGNPIYDWHNMGGGYAWWKNRLKRAFELYDVVRLDHFRAFDEFYAIPYGKTDAREGEWMPGPSIEFFDGLEGKFIAEDLGIITDSVRDLLSRTGYPGMRVLQFGFDGDPANPHLPTNVPENCVCYTGTHDNMTLKQFVDSLDERERALALSLIGANEHGDLADGILESGYNSEAELFVVPLFDLAGLDGEYRINAPGTVSDLNWSCRISEADEKRAKERILRLKATGTR